MSAPMRRRSSLRRRATVAIGLLAAGLLLTGAPSEARPPRRATTTAADQVATLIDEWRFEEAQGELEKLRAAAPDQPGTLYLDAMLRFHRGDYDGAAERLGELRQRFGGRNPAADEAWRDFGDIVESTRAATRGYVEARSPEGHFTIRYQPGRDELLLPYAFEALEAARREIGLRDFEATAALAEPVHVEIYPEVADLAKVSTLTEKEIETSGTIAVCKFNKLMVTSPRALVHGYPWLDTLSHEFTHFVVTRVSHNTVPIWLHEGLAKYEERRWRLPATSAGTSAGNSAGATAGTDGGVAGLALSPTMEHLLASALARGKRLITFEEMSPSMAKLPSQEDTALAFAEVYTVIEYVLSRKGWAGVREVVAQLRGGASDAAAMSQVVGQPFDEFQRSWRAWLRGRKLRVRPGLVPTSLKFARHAKAKANGRRPPAADRDSDHDLDDAEDVSEERARKLVRLGGMLRSKKRLAAAAVEYGKAQQLVGAGHVVVAGKLARTLLALGEAEAAIAAATPAWELYPEQGSLAGVLGEAWLKKGDVARALPFLEAALQGNPFDPAPHCALATVYEGKGDARAARERKACSTLGE